MEPTEPNVSDFHFCHFDRWLQNDGLLCPSLIVTNKQANKQNKNTMTGADPGFFLGGGALVPCSTSTPINHIVFFAEYQLY